jgi:transposase
VLEQAPAPVAHLGIDEHRRGRPRWRTDEQTGEYELLADRWHTCFFDLSGDQGLLGQVEGRTADDAAYWPGAGRPCLAGRDPGRRDRHVRHVCLRGPPDAAGRADRGGLVPRRAQPGAPVTRPVRQDHRHPAGGPAGPEIAAAWIGKEKLRHVLNLRTRVTGSTPCECDVRDRRFAFYDWCAQNDDIPELVSLARTVSRWEEEIVCVVLTGVTNAASESLNRLAKLEARLAYGFRSPANQRRRVRIACTRSRNHAPQPAREHTPVTGPKPHPG